MIDHEVVLGSLFDMVHVTDAQGKTLYCSSGYAEYFGIDPQDMLGKPIEDFFTKVSYYPRLPCV